MITLMKSLLYPVSNAEFANGRGEGVYKQTKSDHPLCDIWKQKTQILIAHQKEEIDWTQKSSAIPQKKFG